MNRTFSNWLVIGLGLIVALLLVNAGIAYRQTRQLHHDAYWLTHTVDKRAESLPDMSPYLTMQLSTCRNPGLVRRGS
jgi:hypothetical protein